MKPLYLTADRAFLRYTELPGKDPPLIWLHGWLCSATGELLPAAVQAPLRGRRSLLVDLLGHGYSDKPLDFGYRLEDHARAVAALIDATRLRECGVVGHGMGGGIGILVAAARPTIVSLLVIAEGYLGPEGDDLLVGQTEDQFVERGFGGLLAAHAREAQAEPDGLRAAHLGMTRLLEPRATYREAASMELEREPSLLSLVGNLDMPRWYVHGELSDPQPEVERELASMGVGRKIVPRTGHILGLQNPLGFAQALAEVVAASWPG